MTSICYAAWTVKHFDSEGIKLLFVCVSVRESKAVQGTLHVKRKGYCL